MLCLIFSVLIFAGSFKYIGLLPEGAEYGSPYLSLKGYLRLVVSESLKKADAASDGNGPDGFPVPHTEARTGKTNPNPKKNFLMLFKENNY